MKIDHIGTVVPSLEDGIQQWTNLYRYVQKSTPILNKIQKVLVVFLQMRILL
jgi:hypothetical protein